MNKTTEITRRGFLKGTATTLGGLSISMSLPAMAGMRNEPVGSDVSVWLHIAPNDAITIRVPTSEMGQGVNTSLPMILADELDANWNLVSSETAPVIPEFINEIAKIRGTGGSASIRWGWNQVARAGAAAREMLMTAAADQWQVPVTELSTDNSRVIHASTGRSATYGSLADAAGQLPVPQNPKLKTPDQYQLIGKPTDRLDVPDKTNGQAIYSIDVQVPDMVYATVAASPTFVGKLKQYDEKAAMSVKGVQQVVTLPSSLYIETGIQSTVSIGDAVAVVADSYWQAKKGLDALAPEFEQGDITYLDTESLYASFKAASSQPGFVVRNDGDVQAQEAAASQVIEGDYAVPYLAHLTMEPMNCNADYRRVDGKDHLELWIPTQSETHTSFLLQKLLGLSGDQITMHTTLMGGGLGRRFEADFAVQAALISKQAGKPVKMIWSREEDVQHDYYRPGSYAKFRVSLSESGLPVSWDQHITCASVAKRNFAYAMAGGFDAFSVEGAVGVPYAIADRKLSVTQHDTHIPAGSWRSVGNSQNGFYVESMMDEVATAGGKSPFELRRELLAGEARYLNVLNELEARSNWGDKPAAGHFRGMALHQCFGTIVGEVAEISLTSSGDIKLERMTCVVDCGKVVNPITVRSQMEGSMLDGLTAALWAEVKVKDGAVAQSNYHDYRFMKLKEVPKMDVHIIESDGKPGGAGEPGTPPSMPALANAVFAATGKRARRLPLEA